MSSPLLAHLRENRLDHPTLDAALRSEPAAVLSALDGAARDHPEWFTAEVLATLEEHRAGDPRRWFGLLHRLASKDAGRAPVAMAAYARRFAEFPQPAIRELYYVAKEDPQFLDDALIEALCAGLSAEYYKAFDTLRLTAARRPELIRNETLERVLPRIETGGNQVFGFLREVVRKIPEATPLCTLAFFEVVLRETNLYIKREMLGEIAAIAELSAVKTGLEHALRQPLAAGTKAARTLMAVLFRQKYRTRQQVLFDALKMAAGSPRLWEFLVFLFQSSDARIVSSSAAEEFLESAYRLSMLLPDLEFEQVLLNKLSLPRRLEAAFPADVAFLAEDGALLDLYRRVCAYAANFGYAPKLVPLQEHRDRVAATEREREAIVRRRREAPAGKDVALDARLASLDARLERWRRGETSAQERRGLAKRIRDALLAEAVEMTLGTVVSATEAAYRSAVRRVLGRDYDLSKVEPAVLPAFVLILRLPEGSNRTYLTRLLEDRLAERAHDWLWTEPPAAAWVEAVKRERPGIRLDRWRAAWARGYAYRPQDASQEKRRRIRADLAQTRALFARVGVSGLEDANLERLNQAQAALTARPPEGADPALVEEIGVNLRRVAATEATPDSDWEGRIELSVETDPFRYLFMGEYGFASCLSLRGNHFWGAIANALDVDKIVVWAKDEGGNIVGRRLFALTPAGVVSYRTYTNRHGLALDGFFEDFHERYAEHCGTAVARKVAVRELLSERWYDDGAL